MKAVTVSTKTRGAMEEAGPMGEMAGKLCARTHTHTNKNRNTHMHIPITKHAHVCTFSVCVCVAVAVAREGKEDQPPTLQ